MLYISLRHIFMEKQKAHTEREASDAQEKLSNLSAFDLAWEETRRLINVDRLLGIVILKAGELGLIALPIVDFYSIDDLRR